MDAAFVMILFVTLSYPMNNLCGFGNKLLIKGKSRVNGGCQNVYGICSAILFSLG